MSRSRTARYYVKQSGNMFRTPRNRAGYSNVSCGAYRTVSAHATLAEALPAAREARDRGGLRRTKIVHKGKAVWNDGDA